MTPKAIIQQFESGNVSSFKHKDHIKLAWAYLHEYSTSQAIDKFSSALKAFAAKQGATDLYHETITWAYLLIIAERLNKDDSWESFAAQNPDLFVWPNGVLNSYYSPELLKTARAKGRFILPKVR